MIQIKITYSGSINPTNPIKRGQGITIIARTGMTSKAIKNKIDIATDKIINVL